VPATPSSPLPLLSVSKRADHHLRSGVRETGSGSPQVLLGLDVQATDRWTKSRDERRPEVPFDPCWGEPFRAENVVRPPADAVVAWSFEAVP
jgi:hypothetical protein